MMLFTETQVGNETPFGGIGFLLLKTFDASSSMNLSVVVQSSITLAPSTVFVVI